MHSNTDPVNATNIEKIDANQALLPKFMNIKVKINDNFLIIIFTHIELLLFFFFGKDSLIFFIEYILSPFVY